jgi:hypothetical protein
MLVRMLFVFIRLTYGPPSRSRYGAWVGFFAAAREVAGPASFEGDSRWETVNGYLLSVRVRQLISVGTARPVTFSRR